MSNELTNVDTRITHEAESSVMALMKRYGSEFAAVIPKQYTPKYFGGLVKVAIAQNPKLAGCTPVSFVNAVLTAASLGLPIRKNSAYLLPYGAECQLLIDYHGKMDLARRAGVGAIHVELVRDGDDFAYGFDREGLKFHWHPGRERGEIEHVFVCAKVNGDIQYTLMSLADIEAIRRRAKQGRALDFEVYGKKLKGLTLADIRALDTEALSFKDPYRQPWVMDYDRMARKTAIHRAAHDWPLSPELMISQEIDVANETGKPMPIEEKLATVIDRIDPADDRPMVEGGGDTYEQQREAIQAVGATELAKSEARRTGPPVTKGQVDTILAAAKRYSMSEEAMRAVLTAHHATSVTQLRQSDFDSVCAAIEERAT